MLDSQQQQSTTYFRHLREGPEADLQRALESQLPSLFPQEQRLVWTAGCIPIGAGHPDLVLTVCEPEILALSSDRMEHKSLVSYLRTVTRARPETISSRTGLSRRSVERSLRHLIDSDVIVFDGRSYALTSEWRSILPEVITIEVKMRDWRSAASQALRNTIFAHRSFIALPERAAAQVSLDADFKKLGLGLISVSESGEARLVRRSRASRPRVWTYYYSLAFLAAKHLRRTSNGLQS